MRIGSISVESVLVAANVVLALGLAVYLGQDTSVAQTTRFEVTPRPAGDLPVLVVVAADSRVDLAVAGPAVERLGGALLAVPAGDVTAAMSRELTDAKPDRVLVLGGPDAVGDETVRLVAELTRSSVTRLSGTDRYATAAKVVTSQFASPLTRLRVMSGDDLDTPGSAPVQGTTDAPLLFVDRDHIPAVVVAALRQMRPGSIEVLGDATAVSEAVREQLEEYTTGEVVRVTRES